VSAGLAPKELDFARDARQPLAKRWKTVEPHWNAARYTGYGRSLDLAARDLYGLARIDRKTIEPLDEAFKSARAAGHTYRTVLKEKSRIRVSLLDSDLGCDRTFFRSVRRLDDFVQVRTQNELAALAKRAGLEAIHSLEELKAACERTIDEELGRGAIGLKCGLAYVRSLRFEKATAAEAEAEFNNLFSDTYIAPSWELQHGHTSKLQDYMMHHVCRLADARGLTFQIHTGLQEGNGNYIHHADPTLLSNLFLEYRNVKFDLFHIGYPYQQTLSALAKNFQNVFIDFAWVHIISPTAATHALVEYLDAVPANKISGFGGDYCFVDGVYGHQVIARENIARALAVKVEQGAFGVDEAKQIARMILHDNPMAIFNLKKHLGR
jgi:predicted TIM-barrel fold metal-dependent hydrolase